MIVGRVCLAHRTHDVAVPIEVHHVRPITRGGIGKDIWARYPGAIRVIAYKGWQMYGLGFIGGMYEPQAAHWTTSGEAKHANVPSYPEIRHAARWSRRWARELRHW